MAEEEQKRQAMLAEDRLEMARLRKGKTSVSAGEALEKEERKESELKMVTNSKRKENKDRCDRRNLESEVICSRSDAEIDYGLC